MSSSLIWNAAATDLLGTIPRLHTDAVLRPRTVFVVSSMMQTIQNTSNNKSFEYRVGHVNTAWQCVSCSDDEHLPSLIIVEIDQSGFLSQKKSRLSCIQNLRNPYVLYITPLHGFWSNIRAIFARIVVTRVAPNMKTPNIHADALIKI